MTSQTSPPSGLHSLSNELVLLTAENLDNASDVSSLCRANHWLLQLVTPLLHKHAMEDRPYGSSMQLAIERNHIALVKLLLSKGVSPNHMSQWHRRSPLQEAIRANSLPMITLLVDHGADVNQRDESGDTPLSIAVSTGKHAVVQNSLPVITLLVDHGADINQRGKSGDTPLSIAVSTGMHAVVQLLLDSGADPALRTIDYAGQGSTPLHKAAGTCPDISMIDMLCKFGAPIDAVLVDNFQYTPL